MPPKHPSRNMLVTIIGFAVILLVFLLAGLWPYLAELRRTQDQIQQRKLALADAALQSERLRDLTQQAKFLQLQVRDYDRLVPENKDLGTFLGQLSRELDDAGMQNTSVRALVSTTLGKVQQLPIEIRGTGTFEQFQSFLTRLENLPRLSSISRLNAESDAAMTGKVTVDITLSIYNTKPNQ